MTKLVIFDLDGTLLNTIEDIADSMNLALQSLGYPAHTEAEYKYFVGSGTRVLAERALSGTGADESVILRAEAEYGRHYDRLSRIKTRPYRGIPDLLGALRSRGVPAAVLSNKPHASTLEVVESYFSGTFARVLGKREGIPVKPDPQGVYELLDFFTLRPADCLYVGDTSVDMRTAKAAGVRVVGVLWGFRDREELEESGADTLIFDPAELLALL